MEKVLWDQDVIVEMCIGKAEALTNEAIFLNGVGVRF